MEAYGGIRREMKGDGDNLREMREIEERWGQIKVIPFNCIAHPSCASFFAGLARARARARSELDRFSMKAQLFRDMNGRFLPNELGDPTFLFHLFK